MVFSRSSFFVMLFFVLVSPPFIKKAIWIYGSKKTTGTMEFIGHGNLGSVLGMSTYPVIQFEVDKKIFHFNGNMDLDLKPHQAVDIRYQETDPANARINTFQCIWADTIVYGLGPLLIYFVLLLSPQIVPWRSNVRLGFRPLIQILPSR